MRNIIILTITALLLSACSATKHVPRGQYLLNKAAIEIEDDNDVVKPSQLRNYLRQVPNHKVLGCVRLQLGMYNLSGRDSTRWYNRWVRDLGQPPVIYSPELTEMSARQLRQALVNRGYTHATVAVDTTVHGRRMDVRYILTPGKPHKLSSVAYEIPDSGIALILDDHRGEIILKEGDLFDRNRLDAERSRITTLLRNNGYYDFNSDYISFRADTAASSTDLDLTLMLRNPGADEPGDGMHRRAIIDSVFINTAADAGPGVPLDTVFNRGYYFIYSPDRYLRPSIMIEKCYLNQGDLFSAQAVQRTYEAFSQLGILRYINIRFTPVGTDADGNRLINATIDLSRTSTQGITFELEGTNSEGDLGVGAGITYQHRNLAKHSELLTIKVRGSYESLSGNLEGLINDRYTEVGAEVGITFPKFEAPILKRRYRQRVKASTEFSFTANYQERPEYTRIIMGAGMRYKWANRRGTESRTLDLIDINYVSLPRSTIDFLNTIAPTNPLLRYSYEDHFIMRLGYSVYKTNRINNFGNLRNKVFQSDIWTLRFSAETAGNLLWVISKATGMRKHDGAYKIFGTQYAQYLKGTAGYTWNHFFNQRNSVALHVDGGIAFPYGNSSMVPFEKRFYAGGANGVRGWGVRTLGPGRYDSHNSVRDFINQCGDISLFMSAEYRAKLFWVLEGALFIDAGNIWTIRDYETQPGGMFHFDSFWKEIALGYGLGVRMDFQYFLLRLDLGMKAHDPAQGHDPWPLIRPRWHRDATFHFSVGYPF